MLPLNEWLPDAKRLPVGHTARVYHGAERRPNLVVRNLEDRYVAWCHACHEGSVQKKDVVKIVQKAPEPKERKPSDPGHLVHYDQWTPQLLTEIAQFLHSKGMSLHILTCTIKPYYTKQDERLVFQTPDQLVGRDLTGQSKAKWYTYTQANSYNRAAYESFRDKHVFVTEDYFSALKGQFEVAQLDHHDVLFVSSMGTVVHPDLALELCKAKAVTMMYDHDEAGVDGTCTALKQLRLLGIETDHVYPHYNCDPKDMDFTWFKQVIKGR